MSVVSTIDQKISMTEGTLRKVDMDNRKVNIKHGPIKNLQMPPMTMVFGVEESVDMSGLAAGEDVDFQVINEGGQMIVKQIKLK